LRKIRKFSFFGFLGVVIAVLFLIGMSLTQAQEVKITKGKPPDKSHGKPDKPGEEQATWAVRIPTSGYIFYGIGNGYYEDKDTNITVSVKKNKMAGPWKKYFNFGYAFDFTLNNENVGEGIPPANVVGFNQAPNLTLVPDDPKTEENESYPDPDKPCCQFPGDSCAGIDCSSCLPTCMANFLNGTHPHAGRTGAGEEDYQYFWFRVNIFDQDIELMEKGDRYLFGKNFPDPDEPGDYLSIVARYRQDCYQEPAYHDVELYRSINESRAHKLNNPMNIMIKRLDATDYEANFGIECDGVWRIWVSDTGYLGITTEPGFLKVKERYCTKVKGKTKWFYPMEAKGTFSFYIDFIKNPTTN